MKREYYISQAIQEAYKSDCKHKHGAVCVKGGKVISRGHNQFKTLRVFTGNRNTRKLVTIHAEMDALTRIDPDDGVDLYVIRIGAHGLANSKPCCVCQELIQSYKVSRVFYSQ